MIEAMVMTDVRKNDAQNLTKVSKIETCSARLTHSWTNNVRLCRNLAATTLRIARRTVKRNTAISHGHLKWNIKILESPQAILFLQVEKGLRVDGRQ